MSSEFDRETLVWEADAWRERCKKAEARLATLESQLAQCVYELEALMDMKCHGSGTRAVVEAAKAALDVGGGK